MNVKLIKRILVLIWIICLKYTLAETLSSGFTTQPSRDLSTIILPSSSTLFSSSLSASIDRSSIQPTEKVSVQSTDRTSIQSTDKVSVQSTVRSSIQSSYSSTYLQISDLTFQITSSVSGNSVVTSDTPVLSTLTVTKSDKFSSDKFHSQPSSTNVVSEQLFSSTERSVHHLSSDLHSLSVQDRKTSSVIAILDSSINEVSSSLMLSSGIFQSYMSSSSVSLSSSYNTFSSVLTDKPISTSNEIFLQDSTISEAVIYSISPTRTISLHSTDSLDIISPSIVTSPLPISLTAPEKSVAHSSSFYQSPIVSEETIAHSRSVYQSSNVPKVTIVHSKSVYQSSNVPEETIAHSKSVYQSSNDLEETIAHSKSVNQSSNIPEETIAHSKSVYQSSNVPKDTIAHSTSVYQSSNVKEETIALSKSIIKSSSSILSEKSSNNVLTVLSDSYFTPSASIASSIQTVRVDIMSSSMLSVDDSSKLKIEHRSLVSLSDLSTSLLHSYITIRSNPVTKQISEQLSTYSDSKLSPTAVGSDFHSSQVLSDFVLTSSMQTDYNNFQTISRHDSKISPTFPVSKSLSSFSTSTEIVSTFSTSSVEIISSNVSSISFVSVVKSPPFINITSTLITNVLQTNITPTSVIPTESFESRKESSSSFSSVQFSVLSVSSSLFTSTIEQRVPLLSQSSSSPMPLYTSSTISALTTEIMHSYAPLDSLLPTTYVEGTSTTDIDTLFTKEVTTMSPTNLYTSGTTSISEQHVNTRLKQSSFFTDDTLSFVHSSMLSDIHSTVSSNVLANSLLTSSPRSVISSSSTISLITKVLSVTNDHTSSSLELLNSVETSGLPWISIHPSKTTDILPIISSDLNSLSVGIQSTGDINTTTNVFKPTSSGKMLMVTETSTMLTKNLNNTVTLPSSDLSSATENYSTTVSSTVPTGVKNIHSSVPLSSTGGLSSNIPTSYINIIHASPSTTIDPMSTVTMSTPTVSPESSGLETQVIDLQTSFETISLSEKPSSLMMSSAALTMSSLPVHDSISSSPSTFIATSPNNMNTMSELSSIQDLALSSSKSKSLSTKLPAHDSITSSSSTYIGTTSNNMITMSELTSMQTYAISSSKSYSTFNQESTLGTTKSLESFNVISSLYSSTIYRSSYVPIAQSSRQNIVSSITNSPDGMISSINKTSTIHEVLPTMTTSVVDEYTSKNSNFLFSESRTFPKVTSVTSTLAFMTFPNTFFSSDGQLITTDNSVFQIRSSITTSFKLSYASLSALSFSASSPNSQRLASSSTQDLRSASSTAVSLATLASPDIPNNSILSSVSVNSSKLHASVHVDSSSFTTITATITTNADTSKLANELTVSRTPLHTATEVYQSIVTSTLTDTVVDQLVITTISPSKTQQTSSLLPQVTSDRTSSQVFSLSLDSDLSTLSLSLRTSETPESKNTISPTLTPSMTASPSSTKSFLSSSSPHVSISSISLSHSNNDTNFVITSSGSSTFHKELLVSTSTVSMGVTDQGFLDSTSTASMDVKESTSSSYVLFSSYHEKSPVNSFTDISGSSQMYSLSDIGLTVSSFNSISLSSLMPSFSVSIQSTSKSISDVILFSSFSESMVTSVLKASSVLTSDSNLLTNSHVPTTESVYVVPSSSLAFSSMLTSPPITASVSTESLSNSLNTHSLSLSVSSVISPSYFVTSLSDSLSTIFTFRDSSDFDAVFTSVASDSKVDKSEITATISTMDLTQTVDRSESMFAFTTSVASSIKSSSGQLTLLSSSFDTLPTDSMFSKTETLSTHRSSSSYVVHLSLSSTVSSFETPFSKELSLSTQSLGIDSSFDSATLKSVYSLTDSMSTRHFTIDSSFLSSIVTMSSLVSESVTSVKVSTSNKFESSKLSLSKLSSYSSIGESSYSSQLLTPIPSEFDSIATLSAFTDITTLSPVYSSDLTRVISSSTDSYDALPTAISSSNLLTPLYESMSTVASTVMSSHVVQSSSPLSVLSFVNSISDTTEYVLLSSYVSSIDTVRHESSLLLSDISSSLSLSEAISISTKIDSSKLSISLLMSPSVTQYSETSIVMSSIDISTVIGTSFMSLSPSVASQLSTDIDSMVSSSILSSQSMFESQSMTLKSVESSSYHLSEAVSSISPSVTQTVSSIVDVLSQYSTSQSVSYLTSILPTSVVVSPALSTSKIEPSLITSSFEIIENSETSLRTSQASTFTSTLSIVDVTLSTTPTISTSNSLVTATASTRLLQTSTLSMSDSNVKSEIVSSSITPVSSTMMASKISSTAFSATISPTSVSSFLSKYSVNSSGLFTDSMFSAFNLSDTVFIGNQSTSMYSIPVSLSMLSETVSVFSSVVNSSTTTTTTTTTTTEPPEVTTQNITNVREAFWVRTVLKIQRDVDTSDPQFVKEMEGRLAEAFDEAFIREKLIEEGKFEPLERRKRKKRYSSSGDASVHIHDMTRQQRTSMVTVVYAVEKSGVILTSEEAVAALQVLGDQELAIILRQVVDMKAETYSHSPEPNEPTNEDFPLWLIGAISGGAALVIAVIWIVICFYCKCCKRQRNEEEAEPELTSILPEHPQRKDSKLRPLSSTPVKKPLSHHNSQHSLKKTNNYTVIEPIQEPVMTNDENKLMETHVKRAPTPPRPLPQPSSPECSTTVTPVLPKRELVPPVVKKGRRNSKNSIEPSIDEIEHRRSSVFSKGKKSNVSHLFQSTVSEDSDGVKEQIKYEKKKNKELLREKYGPEMELSMDTGDSFDDRDKIMLDTSRKNSAPSFVIASGSPAYENPTDQRRNSEGNLLGDGNLEQAKNRMHQLLDDAFSLISPRSHEAFAEINESSTEDIIHNHREHPVEPYKTTKRQLRLEKESQEPFNGYTNPAYTHSSSDYFETWSPYRASDQVALISMPHTLVSSVTKLGQKPDRRLTASRVGKRPASNLDILNTKAPHTDSMKSMSSSSVTREPAEPILLRTKDGGTSSERLTSGKSRSSMGNFRHLNGKPNATKSSSGLILNGSVTSLSQLQNTDLSHTKKESVEMKPLNQNGWAKVRNHRAPEKSIRNQDEVDIVRSVEPHERSENLVQSLRDELKTLTKPDNVTDEDINKKPIRRKNRKINKPMTDIM